MVLIVGYGSEISNTGITMDYWLVQNSWGVAWGDQGLFKIVRGRNLCKIGTDAWVPIVKPPIVKPLTGIKQSRICKRFGDVLTSTIVEKSFCIVESVKKQQRKGITN